MKLVLKIIAAGLVLMVIGIAGCTALVGAGAKSVSDSVNKAQKSDNAGARAFAPKFAKVKVGDTLTGNRGMTFAQVRALLGSPKPGNVVTSQSSGYKLTSWSYDFILANGKSIYSVDFANGKVSNKTSL